MVTRAYRDWLVQTDFLYDRFNLLAQQLTEFILNYGLTDKRFTQEVASKFLDVLASCDEIDYQEDSSATAYGILHFLPRFHRFQLIFSKIVDKHILPLGKKPINVLDIGTGPGPSLFALSDTYLSLKQFGELNGIKLWNNQLYIPDYVERSIGFRNWLHHFTEVANWKLPEKKVGWNVPYHHGTFHDFDNIQFDENYSYWEYDYDGDFIRKTRKVKHRFDIIIFSNFLTQVKQVESLKNELQNCMRFMRNKGKLIVSGGTGENNHNKNYPILYNKVKEILLENVYGNHRFYAKCKYIKIKRNVLSFSYTDRFGQRMKEFNKQIIDRFREHDAIKIIPEKARTIFLTSVTADYSFQSKWEFHVFEKFARLKGSYSRMPLRRKG